MNKKKIFATILCGVFGLSIASGALVANFAHTEEPISAVANPNSIYLIPGETWINNQNNHGPNRWYAMYYFDGNGVEGWIKMEPVEGAPETYGATLENLSNYTVILCAMNPNSSSLGWDAKWNQTQDISIASVDLTTTNVYRVYNDRWDGYENDPNGFWSHYLDEELLQTTREIAVKFDGIDYSAQTIAYHGWTPSNNDYGDNRYVIDGTLERNADGLYVGEVSCALDNIVFQNGDGSLKTNDLQLQNFAKYAQADQLPLYTITKTEDNMWRGSWGGNGSVHAPTTEYARLWYSHGNDYERGYLHTLHYWKDGVDAEVLPTGYVSFGQNDEQYLAYFDVKLEHLFNANIQFKIYDNITGAFQVSTEVNDGTFYSNGDNAHIYYLYDEAGQWHYSNSGSLHDGVQVKGDQLAKVFEAYYTCKNDADNGFADIETLKTTWHVEGATGLDSATINDFANGDTSYTGERNNSTTVANKIAAMEGQYALTNASSPAFYSSITSDSQTIIIVVIALTAFASIVALVVYSIRRRKQETNR